jgi:hypothetical protein
MRRVIKNGPHRVAKRCLYCSEEPFFRRSLTSSSAGKLSVALRDAKGGKFRPQYEDDRQHAFAGRLQRVHKSFDDLVNDGRKRFSKLTVRLFRARHLASALGRLDGVPASRVGLSRAVGFLIQRSCATSWVHSRTLGSDEETTSPLGDLRYLWTCLRTAIGDHAIRVSVNGNKGPRHLCVTSSDRR